MNEALKRYLAKGERVELDAGLLKEHLRAMTEKVVPAIVDEIREAKQLAAELRYAPTTQKKK